MLIARLRSIVPRIMTMKHLYQFSNIEDYKSQVINTLKSVRLQNSNQDLFTAGYIEHFDIDADGKVLIELKLDSDYRKIKTLCSEQLKKFEWIKNIEIRMSPKKANVSTADKTAKRGNLSKVQKLIAVSSCKGGVGKSTIALNLTFALHKLGYKVGLYDADIYGPSVPTLIGKEKHPLSAPEDRPKEIIPVEFEGVKTMSFGYATSNSKAVLRGPMVSSIVTQLIYQTIWDQLDYLIVDMPPGTGDIQITLSQELKFDGAVIVTTPQRLSFIDVVKGIEMFDLLQIPTISVVENMAEYVCTNCQHLHRPFGPGYMNMLQKQFGIAQATSIPLYGDISKYSDLGSPIVLTLPDDHTICQIYEGLAKGVVEEISKTQATPPHVRYETGSKLVIIRQADGTEKKIKSSYLRGKCNCALCVDEFSGKQLLKQTQIDADVYPHKIDPKGNYAVAIIWSDGHRSSIYPYTRLLGAEIDEV